MHITARDAAKFGLLFLKDGVFDGKQVTSSERCMTCCKPLRRERS